MADNTGRTSIDSARAIKVPKLKKYRSERQLVKDFLHGLKIDETPWGPLSVTREFFYQRGRADVVGVCSAGSVVAFEAKLTRWRSALQQAYRNTCFAHRSYVVLPWRTAQVAQKYAVEFDRRRVGLCTLHAGQVLVLHDARRSEPIQPWLAAAVSDEVLRHPPNASARP